MLDRTGRRLADRRCDLSRATLGEHEPGGPSTLCGAADGAKILRILDLIQCDDHRLLAVEQRLSLNVLAFRYVRTDALVPVRARASCDLVSRLQRRADLCVHQ